jgi:spermidine synthase
VTGAWSVPGAPGDGHPRAPTAALLTMVLVIATAGLVYELVMAAVASYVLGDSVTQFSIVIGVYLSALGLGAYASRFVERRLALTFVDVELATALVGGLSAPALFFAFGFTGAFRLVLYSIVVTVGALVGLELPLLIRILERELSLKELIARALTFDYAGALVGSLAFSLLLVPHLGLVHTSIACGLLNGVVALASTWVLAGSTGPERRSMAGARVRAVLVLLVLVVLFFEGGRLRKVSETAMYPGPMLLAEQSPYQRIVVARRGAGFQLFLNGNLQFSSADEFRYHEALVHPAMAAAAEHHRVLIGGGGDGLAVREVLKWPGVQSVTLVDLDRRMTSLAQHSALLAGQNQRSFSDPRVHIVNADAMVWFGTSRDKFDVVLLDFPDPTNYSLGKLYSRRFYKLAATRLASDGAMVVQSTSPMFARDAFWCVVHTLGSVGLSTLPYHVFVPSFGEWGYVLARHHAGPRPGRLPPAPLRYLDPDTLRALFDFPPDMSERPTRLNRLDNQALVAYYLGAWARWN